MKKETRSSYWNTAAHILLILGWVTSGILYLGENSAYRGKHKAEAVARNLRELAQTETEAAQRDRDKLQDFRSDLLDAIGNPYFQTYDYSEKKLLQMALDAKCK